MKVLTSADLPRIRDKIKEATLGGLKYRDGKDYGSSAFFASSIEDRAAFYNLFTLPEGSIRALVVAVLTIDVPAITTDATVYSCIKAGGDTHRLIYHIPQALSGMSSAVLTEILPLTKTAGTAAMTLAHQEFSLDTIGLVAKYQIKFGVYY